MNKLALATWPEIEALRGSISSSEDDSIEAAAMRFTRAFAKRFESIVLARLFLMLPFGRLSAEDQQLLRAQAIPVTPKTPVLCLMGTYGKEAAWQARQLSHGHRVIALLNAASVRQAPMIATLLASLQVDLQGLDEGRPIVTRALLGGLNTMFYVPDAAQARDEKGRHIIPAQDFVKKYGLHTVFGMGGAYVDGTLAISIFFTTETLDLLQVNRFPNFIASFKMASAPLLNKGLLYRA